MARRLGPVLACLLGCGDNRPPPEPDLVGDLAVESVATVSADKVLAIAIAGIDVRTFIVARATTQGADFCQNCLDPKPTDCAATCRRAVLEVTRHRTNGTAEPSGRFHEAFPLTADHDVGALDVIALDDTHAGVAWLECDNATCGPALPRRSCTARYAVVDLLTGRGGPVATLYQGWHGDLQLAFDPRTRRLLALVGEPLASGAGIRAAIYDEQAATQLAPWESYGGRAAAAPAATAGAGGFVIVADDPVPAARGSVEPCTEACDCPPTGVPSLATGGLYAFRPDVDRPAERIAPGRNGDMYRAREAIAAIDAGGRVAVASSQSKDGSAELFEPAAGGWVRRHASRAPSPLWLGALGDEAHLAWIGSEPDPARPDVQHLVGGAVLIGQFEQRGELRALDGGRVRRAAPVAADSGVTTTFLLRDVLTPGGDAASQHFEVLAIHAIW
jgi:hypothetical protein